MLLERHSSIYGKVNHTLAKVISGLGWTTHGRGGSGMSADTIASSTQKDGSSLTSAVGLVKGHKDLMCISCRLPREKHPLRAFGMKSALTHTAPHTQAASRCCGYMGGMRESHLEPRQWP